MADAGERALIDRITARLRAGDGAAPGVVLGPGDDAAVVRAPDASVVATTDVLVEGVHFRTEWSSAYDVGRKAAAQNLADVVAMGARPTALLLGLAVPGAVSVEWVEGLAAGLADESAVVDATVVGGDVVAADRITVSVTALGDLAGHPAVLRSGARPGDVVVLAGVTGRSAAGLAVLQSGDAALLERCATVVAVHRQPAPPYPAGLALARLGATAMIDVSDGLVSEAWHLADASGVGIELDDVPVPVDVAEAAAALGVDPKMWVLHGGEDHALLATVPPDVVPTVRAWAVPIGRVVETPGVRDATGAEVRPAGWQHFRRTGPWQV